MANLKNTTFTGTGAINVPRGPTSSRAGSPDDGHFWYNTDMKCFEYWDGNNWINTETGTESIVASGGCEIDFIHRGVPYRAHIFHSSGTLSVTSGGDMEYLIVGGGGGGGMDMGGGGGGGAVAFGKVRVSNGNQTITVGAGGYGAPSGGGGYRTDGAGPQPSGHQFTISATSGGQSSAFGITADGGGYGGSSYHGYTPNYGNGAAGTNGSSGGGASAYSDGGTGHNGAGSSSGTKVGGAGGSASGQYYGGGGGGAQPENGVSGSSQPNGGHGKMVDILGEDLFWGGGGGGAAYSLSTGGYGGQGGGGGGAVGVTYGDGGQWTTAYNIGAPGEGGSSSAQTNTMGGDAGKNTGGGGGGGSHYNLTNKGGEGGSGIVVVRYPISAAAMTPGYENLRWHNAANMAIHDNYSTRTGVYADGNGGSASWDKKAYTTVSYAAPITLEFNCFASPDGSDNGLSYKMIGLASQTQNASYTTIDYAFYPYYTATCSIYHSGTGQGNYGSGWSCGDKFRLVYGTDGYIRYYIEGTQIHSYNAGTGLSFFVAVAGYRPSNNEFSAIKNIRLIRRAWNGTKYT